ncbi:plakophilin-1-like, partial [Neolamprologus brichardi]|uniref:plakophilin-1-like n=1 Tax=Neolamprologus brichardi TaxID=32507 RepID=UPI0016436BEB
VFQLGGVPTLVALLRSGNPQVCQVAAGALRNLVFQNQSNKLEVQRCGGIAKALQLLKETDSTETQKQITGLLWNLSSADELKEELAATALPALTQHVVVPYTSLSDTGPSSYIDPSVFNCATGCLRNLSSGRGGQRQAMRSCPGLIDSLMSYMKSCVAEQNPDDSSLENCACILHNLSYKLEQESPVSFINYNPNRDAQPEKSPTIGCFSPKSSKAQKTFSFDTVDASPPSGVKWLSHPKAIDTYLSLLESSENKATLEACCGALQNLTASKGNGSDAVSQILVSKSRDLRQFGPLLKPSNPKLQNTAKLTKGSSAASLLLYSIWQDKNLQSAVKKMGLTKSAFINDNITHVVSQLEGQ